MKEKDEDLCEALLHRQNYALAVHSIFIETCLNADARCQLRTVGETLITTSIALGLQKSKQIFLETIKANFKTSWIFIFYLILDSPYKTHFDKALLRMTVDGTLQMLRERWTHNSKCKAMVKYQGHTGHGSWFLIVRFPFSLCCPLT